MHTLSWMAWVFMVMVVSLATTNPYYLVVILLSVLLVSIVAPKTNAGSAGLRALFFFGIGALTLSAAVSVVNGNAGSHILFTVPGPDLPAWMGGLRLGGPVTTEGLVYNLTRGLAVLCIFVAFGVFNAAVSPIRVLRTAPAALFHAGLVVTIGLTLLPSTVEDLRRIREMQALRGMATGLRQLPGLVVPAVIGGLERSMRLAEAMEARGYAASNPPSPMSRIAAAASAPLMLVASFIWLYTDSYRWLAGLAFTLGLGALFAWSWDASRRRRTTRFRPEPFPLVDRLAAVVAPLLGVCAVATRTADLGGLAYNPFAGLPAPTFEPLGSLLALACAWPAVLLLFRTASGSDEAPLRAGTAQEILL